MENNYTSTNDYDYVHSDRSSYRRPGSIHDNVVHDQKVLYRSIQLMCRLDRTMPQFAPWNVTVRPYIFNYESTQLLEVRPTMIQVSAADPLTTGRIRAHRIVNIPYYDRLNQAAVIYDQVENLVIDLLDDCVYDIEPFID